MKRWSFVFFLVIALLWVACVRTDGFSPEIIQAPLFAKQDEPSSTTPFSQPFHYLGKGRQCFVFESADGQYVLKFFNHKYLQMPWYSFLVGPKEKEKRSQRQFYYENSYEIAYREFGEGILYLHLGPTSSLPSISLTDKANREFTVDLNQVPFVLQRKGIPFYDGLQSIYQKEGLPGLNREIDTFVASISKRIEKNIADGDHDVEHNWGYIDGKIFHLDPGRLFYDEHLQEPDRLKKEWSAATRSFHKWLKLHYPEAADHLASALNNH